MSNLVLTGDLSPVQAGYRSGCQAREGTLKTPSTFQQVIAYIPLYGFGAFNSSSVYGSLVYNDTWPRVYAKLVETWIDDYAGVLKTVTTVFSKYCDVGKISNTVIYGGGTAEPDSIISTTVTDSLVSVRYFIGQPPGSHASGYGTYTAQLSGTILDTSAGGPFDPTAATNGWQALVDLANAMLDATAIPASTAPTSGVTALYPISTGTGIGSAAGSSLNLITAAFNGLPVRGGTVLGYTPPSIYNQAISTIVDSNPFPRLVLP
jgi:hypothetical protein